MSLHDDIMGITANPDPRVDPDKWGAYRIGHRDARHAAAELAAKRETELLCEIADLRLILEEVKETDIASYGERGSFLLPQGVRQMIQRATK